VEFLLPIIVQSPIISLRCSPARQRYLQGQLGNSIETIAADHGVTYNAVKNSIQRCEVRMRPAEVLAGRNA